MSRRKLDTIEYVPCAAPGCDYIRRVTVSYHEPSRLWPDGRHVSGGDYCAACKAEQDYRRAERRAQRAKKRALDIRRRQNATMARRRREGWEPPPPREVTYHAVVWDDEMARESRFGYTIYGSRRAACGDKKSRRLTDEREEVNCRKCLRLLAEGNVEIDRV